MKHLSVERIKGLEKSISLITGHSDSEHDIRSSEWQVGNSSLPEDKHPKSDEFVKAYLEFQNSFDKIKQLLSEL